MACRLCAHSRAKLLYRLRGWPIERCERCGFVQVAERPSERDLEAIYSAGYFDHGKYGDDFAQRKENEKRRGLLEKLGLDAKARVLDAGCATGDFIHYVGDRFEMWGLELSEHAAEEARRRNPTASARIYSAPLESMPFDAGFFDAIVLWDVVEHLWDPVDVLTRLSASLRPGGHLLVSTPNIGALTAKLMKQRWAFMTPPEHLGLFSDETMRILLEERLGLHRVFGFSTGKWVNLGFLFYKLRRVFPAIPEAIVSVVRTSPVGNKTVYVPTQDIQYVGARKEG